MQSCLLRLGADGARADRAKMGERLHWACPAPDEMGCEDRSCPPLSHQAVHGDCSPARSLPVDEVEGMPELCGQRRGQVWNGEMEHLQGLMRQHFRLQRRFGQGEKGPHPLLLQPAQITLQSLDRLIRSVSVPRSGARSDLMRAGPRATRQNALQQPVKAMHDDPVPLLWPYRQGMRERWQPTSPVPVGPDLSFGAGD